MAFIAPDAIVNYWSAHERDEIPGLHGHMPARGLVISAEPCQEQTGVASSGGLADATKYQCEATFVEAISVAKGFEPYDVVVDVWLVDGQVGLLRLDWDRWERYEGELVSFFDWMADNHWESWIVLNDQSGFPSGTPEANVLWKQYVDQYIAEELS